MASCLIGLGSNLGDRAEYLDQAVAALRAHPDISNLSVSSYHATKPIGGPADQTEFLNAAVRCETSLAPAAILAELHRIESQLGRTREMRWSARTIDLDLLLYGDVIIESYALTVPHPRMAYRRFVLEPAAEIAKDLVHSPTGLTIDRLLARLDLAPYYVAVTGGKYIERAIAARRAAKMVGGRYIHDPVGREFETYTRDTSRPTPGKQREMIRLRRAALREVFDGTRDQFAISSFWIDESFALAQVIPPTLESAQVQLIASNHWVMNCAPKLLVFVGQGFPGAELCGDQPAFERALIARAKSHKQVPLLTLPTTAPEAVAEELAAAVWAMQ